MKVSRSIVTAKKIVTLADLDEHVNDAGLMVEIVDRLRSQMYREIDRIVGDKPLSFVTPPRLTLVVEGIIEVKK